jgi:carbonic anhydrase
VPVSLITGSQLGDILVQRNIANQVNTENALAIVDYAVEHLKIQHIIVCGHTHCYGIKAACDKLTKSDKQTDYGHHIAHCISEIVELAQASKDQLCANSEIDSNTLLAEKNVAAQVSRLAQLDVVQKAWSQGQALQIHGYLFEMQTGLLKDLRISRSSNA